MKANNHYEICVIGAGVAGLAATQRLLDAGVEDICVIDKGRSVGGRVATRRLRAGRVDHGAQFLTARHPAFQAAVANWRQRQWLIPWFGEPAQPRYVAPEGMNHWLKQWAATTMTQIPLLLNERVTQVRWIERAHSKVNQWQLATINDRGEWCEYTADALLMTAPVPQSLVLLDHIFTQNHEFKTTTNDMQLLQAVHYDACIALLIASDDNGHLSTPDLLNQDLPAPLAWVADNLQKGISMQPTFTVHLTPEWSNQHYDDSEEQIKNAILPLLPTVLGVSKLADIQVKKWRYALATKLFPSPYYVAGTSAPLMLAGDGFASDLQSSSTAQGRIETAWLSGTAAAEHLVQWQRTKASRN